MGDESVNGKPQFLVWRSGKLAASSCTAVCAVVAKHKLGQVGAVGSQVARRKVVCFFPIIKHNVVSCIIILSGFGICFGWWWPGSLFAACCLEKQGLASSASTSTAVVAIFRCCLLQSFVFADAVIQWVSGWRVPKKSKMR